MKKIFIYVFLASLFYSNVFAEQTKPIMNQHIKNGYKVIETETGKSKSTRFYTLKKGNNLMICRVVVGLEYGRTFCYEP